MVNLENESKGQNVQVKGN